MTMQVTATVIGGLLKPDRKLELADQTRVNLTIEPVGERLEPVDGVRVAFPLDGAAAQRVRIEGVAAHVVATSFGVVVGDARERGYPAHRNRS